MLPRQHRLNHSADLRHTLRRGRRFVIPQAVISVLPSTLPHTRIGVVTPKIVGNSVARHRVARAIRHGALGFIAMHPHGFDVAIRAQTGANALSVADWARILEESLETNSKSKSTNS